MKRGVLFFLIIFLTGASGGSAQTLGENPQAALAILKEHIQRHPPPLEVSEVRRGFSFFAAGSLASVGCAGLALIPTFENWGPEEKPHEYFWNSSGWGALQGLSLNPLVGMGLAFLMFPSPDIRAEYGRLLDLNEPDQEQRAYLILRAMARRGKHQRIAASVLMVAATAVPAGAYYLGSAVAGPNPNVKDVGLGYVVGVAIGSLVFAFIPLHDKSAEETLFEQVRAGDRSGSKK
jgi:hypothetical protein